MALIKILLTYLSFMALTDVIAVSASPSTSRSYTGGNGSSCHNWHCRSHVKEEDVPYDLLDNTHTARSRSRRTHRSRMPTNHPSETERDTETDTLSDMELKDDIECYLASRSKCRMSHDDVNTNTETNTETETEAEASTFWTPLPTKHPLHHHHHYRRRDDEQASRNDIQLYNHQETLQYKYKYRQGYNIMTHDHPTTTTRMNPSNVLSLRGGGAGSYLPAGWHPFGYGITDVGIRFLEFDGSLESDVGRFLASLKSGRKKRSILKEQWVEIVRVSKSGQSMRILRTLDHLIEFCLEAGLIR